jgi:brefeldin A-resistance guanine nucleotide exchange factor 1
VSTLAADVTRPLLTAPRSQESIPELTKNVLLVMNASEVLLPPPAPGAPEQRSGEQVALWALTAERLAQFLPGLLDELFGAAPIRMPETAAAAPEAGAAGGQAA